MLRRSCLVISRYEDLRALRRLWFLWANPDQVAVIYGTANAARVFGRAIFRLIICGGYDLSRRLHQRSRAAADDQIPVLDSVRESRIRSLYTADEQMRFAKLQDNPEIQRV